MNTYSITDVGQKREINQDYVYCNECSVGALPNLFIVADGMGGHNAGDFASRYCVDEMVKLIGESEEKTVIGMLDTAVAKTNEMLLKQAREQTGLEGMGTTLVLATIIDQLMYVANIGDSRLYLINDTMKQITEDHSLVEEMVKTGEIKRSEARYHPKKNVITRAVGASLTVVPDYFEVGVKSRDIILLCSDGLSNMLEDDEILAIIKNNGDNLEASGKELIEKANENGGKDNIAIVLIRLD